MQGNPPEQVYVSRMSSVQPIQDSRLGRCSLSRFWTGGVSCSRRIEIVVEDAVLQGQYPDSCTFSVHRTGLTVQPQHRGGRWFSMLHHAHRGMNESRGEVKTFPASTEMVYQESTFGRAWQVRHGSLWTPLRGKQGTFHNAIAVWWLSIAWHFPEQSHGHQMGFESHWTACCAILTRP